MKFKQWILKEMGHIEVLGDTGSKEIAVIDPMFEKYPKSLWNSQQGLGNSIWGKIPRENKWMVYKADHNTGNVAIIQLSPPSGGYELPPDWWDYADVIYADGSEKKPTKP